MGRTARRPGPPSFLFGVWGEGETSPENIDALLGEHIEGLGEITPRFVIPCDKEITTDTHLAVFEFAQANDYAVEVVQAAAPRVKALREMRDYAEKVHEADDADNTIEKVFAEVLGSKAPDDAQLLFLWAEVDGEPVEDDQRVLFDCLDAGVIALDLTQGLDALGAEGGGDDGGDGDEPTKDDEKGDDEPAEAAVREWPVRRIRTYALEVAAAREEAGEKDLPSDDAINDMGKGELLEFLYGPDEPEPEKPAARSRRGSKSAEPAKDDEKVTSITPRRARQMREESEKEGTDSTTKNRRRGAASAAEEPAAEPEAGGEGQDTPSDALERFKDALAELSSAIANDDTEAEDAGWLAFADTFADVIIDRIAARVEKEPEESAVRQEIAPKRPPGKPRKDGATPTRRRTRA